MELGRSVIEDRGQAYDRASEDTVDKPPPTKPREFGIDDQLAVGIWLAATTGASEFAHLVEVVEFLRGNGAVQEIATLEVLSGAETHGNQVDFTVCMR